MCSEDNSVVRLPIVRVRQPDGHSAPQSKSQQQQQQQQQSLLFNTHIMQKHYFLFPLISVRKICFKGEPPTLLVHSVGQRIQPLATPPACRGASTSIRSSPQQHVQ